MKYGLAHRAEFATKRLCKSLREGPRKMAELRQLIVVCDKRAKFEVQARQQVKKVSLTNDTFPTVRRNKKILKVLQMMKAEWKSNKMIHVVTSRKKGLSEIETLYGHDVVQVLKHPENFDFHREKDNRVLWNITREKSSSVIMQTDLTQEHFKYLRDPLERDIGVLKTSVEQLLAKKEHDVVAVNTHPGHHAGPKRAMNYCTLNNIAIAARLLKEARPSLKLGVLDLDVHPGDGTQEFVEQHRHLIKKYVSIHCTTRFENMNSSLGSNGVGLRLDKEFKVIPERFIAKIAEVLTAWNRERLDVIIVAMGFDTLKRDPLAKVGFQMLPVHFRDIGYMFAQRPEQLFFVQEGGYNLNETARAFDYLIKGFKRGRSELAS
jgi:acetoin utilization deacetylase AcuC-like enzyme